MSVKNKESVGSYVADVSAIQAALENLQEFVSTLPAPSDSGELENLHYGHLGTISFVKGLLAQATEAIDGFSKGRNHVQR